MKNHTQDLLSLPIGVFDSGMGGLTVLKSLKQDLPNESFIYFGDTARLPYGTKSKETIIKYSEQAINKLLEINVKMIVIACNSATVSSLDYLQNKYKDIAIIGVVKPGAKASAAVTQTNHIGIIATERTISSGCYEASLKELNPDFRVSTKPCNILATLAEEGHVDDSIARCVIQEYLSNIVNNNQDLDTLLLGCTHFPVFKKVIEEILPAHIKVIDSAECTAKSAYELLNNSNLLNNSIQNNSYVKYYVTDSPERFARVGELFLGQGISDINLL